MNRHERLSSAVRAFKNKAPTLMALCAISGVAVLAVFPAQAYLAQRHHREALAAELSTVSSTNRDLEARARLLQTDGEIERLARLQYNLVRPGEETFTILPPAGSSALAAPDADAVVPGSRN